jgi:capsular exopolysaccharide synthesis family protein
MIVFRTAPEEFPMPPFPTKGPEAGPLQPADPEESRKIAIASEELAMVHAPQSQIAEQFRVLRNSIVTLNPEGAPRTIVVTSALSGEGKTVATLNLAVAMTELARTQVLVVDADLHHPSIERYLSLPRRQGLAELLRGECSIDRAVRATSSPGLSVVGAGSLPRNPSELLASERLKTLIASFKQRFSYILFDSPEAMTISDASLLGAQCDGIVLVVRLGSTPRHYVEQTSNLLESMGGNVLGTCLTGANEVDTAARYARR